ncbi:FAD-dependent oxidoreductase [Actinokineospora soli]|uniref:FAD-dependent oxidoreductase n=1 Tax=Actinokineospora soli TaxID=1048753 RepID=A0ABW2TJ40_9PSEU
MAWDVVVAGGGIAGVSVAAELAAHRSVLLVEAEAELARHTTGRSAAVYLPSYGGPVVRALTAASRARIPDGLLTPRATLWVSTDGPAPAIPGATPIDPDRARELCPALRPGVVTAAAVDEHTADIDAMALHQHYVRLLRAAAARSAAARRSPP